MEFEIFDNFTKDAPKEGDLKIWWIPQVPMKAFTFRVPDLRTAQQMLDVLAQYDLFQWRNDVKPDYSNAGGLQVFEDGEWTDWYSEDGDDFDEVINLQPKGVNNEGQTLRPQKQPG